MSEQYDPNVEFANAIRGDVLNVLETWAEEEWDDPHARKSFILTTASNLLLFIAEDPKIDRLIVEKIVSQIDGLRLTPKE